MSGPRLEKIPKDGDRASQAKSRGIPGLPKRTWRTRRVRHSVLCGVRGVQRVRASGRKSLDYDHSRRSMLRPSPHGLLTAPTKPTEATRTLAREQAQQADCRVHGDDDQDDNGDGVELSTTAMTI